MVSLVAVIRGRGAVRRAPYLFEWSFVRNKVAVGERETHLYLWLD